MIESILSVVLRLVFIILAFGVLTTVFLVRMLLRRAYAVAMRLVSQRQSDLRTRAT